MILEFLALTPTERLRRNEEASRMVLELGSPRDQAHLLLIDETLARR